MKNAKKFTSEGYIEIKACYNYATKSLEVHIKDTGVGIAAEDRDKLFKKFGKLKRNAEMNSEGIGLGLTIVQGIVESSGGRCRVSSKGPGQGSVFSFNMPMPEVDRSLYRNKLVVLKEKNVD